MKEKMIVACVVMLLFAGMARGEKLATVDDVLKPTLLRVDSNYFYVVEQFKIHIFSMKDYSLVKTFGKQGEGPQEFNRFVLLTIQPDQLLINSMGKVSFYSKEGEFKNELKPSFLSWVFKPLGDKNFAAFGQTVEDETRYTVLNLLDEKLVKVKELGRMEVPIKPGAKLDPLKILKRPVLFTRGDKAFVLDPIEGSVQCYDKTGKHLRTINPAIDKTPFTKEDEKRYRDFFKSNTNTSVQYQRFLPLIQFPKHYLPVKDFILSDNRLYLITHKKIGGQLECLVLGLDGKLIKKGKVPLVEATPMEDFPYHIRDGKFYTIIEDEDTEDMELHATPI